MSFTSKWKSGMHETIIILMCYSVQYSWGGGAHSVITSVLLYSYLLWTILLLLQPSEGSRLSNICCKFCKLLHMLKLSWETPGMRLLKLHTSVPVMYCVMLHFYWYTQKAFVSQSLTSYPLSDPQSMHPFCWGRVYRPMEVLQMTMWTWSLMTDAAVSGC